jgi:Aldehyde dehydrogenase family
VQSTRHTDTQLYCQYLGCKHIRAWLCADPVNLAVSKIGPALMAGNAVVIKPPTQGAVSAIQMVQVRSSLMASSWQWCPLSEGESSVYMPGMQCDAGLSRDNKHMCSPC